MSSTWSSLGRVSKWFEAPCQNPAIGSCFICQKPFSPLFLSGESLEFPHFPGTFQSPLSGVWIPGAVPAHLTQGMSLGGAAPTHPSSPLQAAPVCPFPPPRQPGMCQGWDEPTKGVLREGSWDPANSPLPRQDVGVPLHIPPTPVTGTRTGWVPTGRGAGAEGTEGRDPQAGPSNPIETSFLSPFPTDLVTPCGSGDPLCAHLPLGGVTPSSFPSQGEEAQPGQQLPSPAHLTRGHSSVA